MYEIEKIANNYSHWKKDRRGYTTFFRFTEKQLEEYAKDSMFEVMSKSSAGVYLSFYTTGDEVTFDYKVISPAKFIAAFVKDFQLDKLRNFFLKLEKRMEDKDNEPIIRPIIQERKNGEFKFDGFDFVLNDNNVVFHEMESGKVKFKIFNPDKEKVHIKIYFPLIFNVAIRKLQINGEVEYDTDHKEQILCIGDSITQGLFSGNSSLNYVARLANNLNVKALNQGVSGYFFNHKSLDGIENLNINPKFITVAYGTNDWFKKSSIEEIVNDMEAYFEKLIDKFPDKKIFVLSPIWRGDMSKVPQTGSFYHIKTNLIEITNKYENITVIDGLNFVPHDSNFFADEYLHPNADGFEHMAFNISNEIKKHL